MDDLNTIIQDLRSYGKYGVDKTTVIERVRERKLPAARYLPDASVDLQRKYVNALARYAIFRIIDGDNIDDALSGFAAKDVAVGIIERGDFQIFIND